MSTMAMEEEPSFSSLPHDIVLNVLAHVPRRYHPILCSVSKKLRSLVRSSEFHKTRSLMGKEYCFYVCIKEIVHSEFLSLTYQWFTLIENRCLVPMPFPSPPPESYSEALMVGPEIYFVGGSLTNPSRSMWILDSRSGKLRQGPSRLVARNYSAVGFIDEKIYIFGGCCDDKDEKIQAQVFDPKTQTWGIAANPSVEMQSRWISIISQSSDRKIYARNWLGKDILVYDLRDGNCEMIELPTTHINYRSVCVIANVLYMYHSHFGLMWYNSKEKEWRVVHGLKFNKHFSETAMAEYNGKLAFLWHERKKMEIWCAVISLRRSGLAEVHGRVEWSSRLLSDVPSTYFIMHCLGRTD